jgi:LPS export ABC transporter protein LptC
MRPAAFLPVLALLAACNQQSTTPSTSAEAFDLPADVITNGVRHNMTQDGIRRAVITSDTSYHYEATRQVDMVGVEVTFYDEAGEEAGTLTARRGDYDLANNIFTAKEEVVLVSQGPRGERRLRTDELGYDLRADRLWSDRAFTLEEGGRTNRGTSFRSDAKLETWVVTGAQASGTVEGDGELSF